MTFETLGLPESLTRAVADAGYDARVAGDAPAHAMRPTRLLPQL